MALCDFVIEQGIVGLDCNTPPVKGAESMGALINRADINYPSIQFDYTDFEVSFTNEYAFKCDKRGYRVYQSGKQPFQGTQQELVEGVYANTITNTIQLIVLKQDENWAEQLFALINGEFVAVIPNKDGSVQAYGLECGLHCTGAVRELYNDDTLSGWLITFTEEGASRGNWFVRDQNWHDVFSTGMCD